KARDPSIDVIDEFIAPVVVNEIGCSRCVRVEFSVGPIRERPTQDGSYLPFEVYQVAEQAAAVGVPFLARLEFVAGSFVSKGLQVADRLRQIFLLGCDRLEFM